MQSATPLWNSGRAASIPSRSKGSVGPLPPHFKVFRPSNLHGHHSKAFDERIARRKMKPDTTTLRGVRHMLTSAKVLLVALFSSIL